MVTQDKERVSSRVLMATLGQVRMVPARRAMVGTLGLILLVACTDNAGLFTHDAGPVRDASRNQSAGSPVAIDVNLTQEPWWAPYKRMCDQLGGQFEVTDSDLPVCTRSADGGFDAQ